MTDIFQSITPDVLHQLHQGVIKHLLAWVTDIIGDDKVDAHVKQLLLNHSIHDFHKGITSLLRVMGAEHKQMSCFLLIDVPLPQAQSSEFISMTKALLDFLYMLQYLVHSETTLKALEGSLANFHAKKDVFIRLGAHSHFLIPKLHMITHYVHAIKLYGMTDNYNTEMTKHLHIDFVKEAYHVMSHKDEFLQMIKWLECREKVLQLADYIQWCMLCADSGHDTMITLCQGVHWQPPDLACTVFHLMTKYPSHKAVPVTQLISLDSYGATHLMLVLVEHNNPGSHGVKSNFKLCLFGFHS